ncbi:MAG TPA: hypothetical protein VJ464_22400, partial [Blastocatellia bacterium]|nr:hypothetical protein [Blastocatellia bacterium]
PNQTSSVDVNDRLASDSYDSNGNTIGSAGNTYQYDSENRLVALNAGTAAEVRYCQQARRTDPLASMKN